MRLLLFPAFLALVSVVLARGAQLHTHSFFPVNDFWQLLDQATILDWKRLETWYNGFFPPGYPWLLTLPPGEPTPAGAWQLHLAAIGLLVFAVSLTAQALSNRWGAGLAAAILWLQPYSFFYLLTPGPDVWAMALWAMSLAALWARGGEAPSMRGPLILSGACLGAAMLMRSHMLPLAVGTVLAVTVLNPREQRWRAAWLLPGILSAWLLQRGIAWASGQSGYEAAQLFNIYRQVYPTSWWDPPATIPLTLWQMIAQEPVRYLDAWLRGPQWYLSLLLPALAGAWWGGRSRFHLFALITGLPYLLVVAIAISHRAALPLLPLFAICVALLLRPQNWRLPTQPFLLSTAQWAVTAAFLGLLTMSTLRDNWKQVQVFRAYSRDMAAIEARLKRAGAQAATEILSDNHEIYFNDLKGWRPSTNGTWAVLPYAVWQYEQRHPRFDVSSWEAFRSDCRRHGVQWLVLSPSAAQWTPFFKSILQGTAQSRTRVENIARVGQFQIYRLK